MEWSIAFVVKSVLLGAGLAMDAFSVSLANGLNEPCMKKPRMTLIAGLFAFFQALMPLLGWLMAGMIGQMIRSVDYWIAFILLGLIGFNMLREALTGEEACESCNCDLSFKTMLALAIATSIDALAVGVQLYAQEANIWIAIALIGGITFLVCTAGVKIGNVFGSRYEKRAQIVGGVILMGLGIKFLIEGLIENFV